MKLTNKIIFLFFLFWSFLVLGYFLIYLLIMKPTFTQIEMELAKEELERFHKAVDRELGYLVSTCKDYAWWDDTYEFVENRNSSFIEINLLPQMFLENKINLVIIINKLGEVVYSAWYDLEPLKERGLPLELSIKRWALTNPLINFRNPKECKSGFFKSSFGILVLASSQILPSSSIGTTRGFFIMGRLVTDDFWKIIKANAVITSDVYLFEEKHRIIGNHVIHLEEPNEFPLIDMKSHDELSIWDLIKDIRGNPILLVNVLHPQKILSTAETMQIRAVVYFLLIILGSVLIFWSLIQRQVVLPLIELTRKVCSSTLSNVIFPIDVQLRNDEISLLLLHFNRMAFKINNLLEEKTRWGLETEKREEHFRTIINNVPCVIIEINSQGRIQLINEQCKQLLDMECSELIGKSISEIIMFTELNDYILKSKDDNTVFDQIEFEKKVKRENQDRYYQIKVRKKIAGEQIYYIAIIWDITELRETREKLEHQKRLALLGEASASLAHELRNMLSSIQSGFRLIQEVDGDIEKRRVITEELSSAINRLEETLRKLLEFTKQYQVVKTKIPCRDIIQEQFNVLKQSKLVNEVELQIKGEIEIYADMNLFSRVFWNILKNSIDSMKNGGLIVVELMENDKVSSIVIKDNGIGMDKETLDKVGTPFFTTKSQGTGLGLAITKRVVESHGGTLKIDSELGKGTVIEIILPKEN